MASLNFWFFNEREPLLFRSAIPSEKLFPSDSNTYLIKSWAFAFFDSAIFAQAFRGELVLLSPNDEPVSGQLNRARKKVIQGRKSFAWIFQT